MDAKTAEQGQLRGQNQAASRNQSQGQNQSSSRHQSRGSNGTATRGQSQRGLSQPRVDNEPGGLKQPSGLMDTEGNGHQTAGSNGQVDMDKVIDEAHTEQERRSTRQATGASRTAKSVAGSYADDEWSDFENGPQPLSDRQYDHLSKRKYGGRIRDCDCYPGVSKVGQPSMVYDKLYCKHSQATGHAHQEAKAFSNNWTNPGELPPIHKTDFVVKRQPQKPRKYPKYTVLMGYPTSMYGYNEPLKVAAKEAADAAAVESQDADDESDYTDDSDAETIQEDEEEAEESDVDDDDNKGGTAISKNRRDLYKQKTVKRTVVTSFSSQPRAVVNEYKSFLEEEGYLAGDEVYANYDYLQARMKKGRSLNGRFLNQGKMESFDMKTDGQTWKFNRGLVDETK